MGRPRKEKGALTFDDFVQYLSAQEHDWLVEKRLNEYVNRAAGIDLFSTAGWPLPYTVEEGKITMGNVVWYDDDEFDYPTAVKYVEELLNDSERS